MSSYRRSSENGLMTSLNSISSAKSSVDNLLLQRCQGSMSSAWWRNHPKEEQQYSTTASVNHHVVGKDLKGSCFSSRSALTFTLSILLLLTIFRQTYDFLSQLWLQILINFFSVLIIIIALFGIRQNRLSYLGLFVVWALFNTIWNLLVISIHLKGRDIIISEDLLSLYTGGVSWWHTNGPGCQPYSITASLHQSVSILKPNIITGCRFDYHVLESAQAAAHSCLSFVSMLLCCHVALVIRRDTHHIVTRKVEKPYHLNELTNGRSKVNHDPFPLNNTSRFVTEPATLRRAANKVSSRASQHSMASARSDRKRPAARTPRGSTSSVQRSQKYGSLSSRRSNRRTHATTSLEPRASGSAQRTRQSSVSSTDYLPSYQPPHSSSANLLSSYGEISSIDSYNNRRRMKDRGNTNPIYDGSRTSICSQSINTNNNYDDISNVYGVYGTSRR